MAAYKLFIPCAGTGSRLGKLTDKLNKALVHVNHTPVISHIIEQFDIDVEIVIALGHAKKILQDYLTLVYPDRKITFVYIDNYEGPGSGLGHTIRSCKNELQCPFIFWANDTLFYSSTKLIPDNNFLCFTDEQKTGKYRSLQIDRDTSTVTGLIEEQTEYSKTYVGIAGIYNYEQFWQQIDLHQDPLYGEAHALIDADIDISTINGQWYDIGNSLELDKTRQIFNTKLQSYSILDKADEEIWFANNKVIKFHNNPDVIKKRVWRSEPMKGFIPEILGHTNDLLVYSHIAGETVADTIERHCRGDLEFLNSVFSYIDEFLLLLPPIYNSSNFKKSCQEFYKTKSEQRAYQLLSQYEYLQYPLKINGLLCRPITELFNQIEWDKLSETAIPCRWHGDLHFDNIICNEAGFTLIDWRPDFDNMNYGDIYYEMAKLNHSIILPNSILANHSFRITGDVLNKNISFDISYIYIQAQILLRQLALKKALDWTIIEILTYLIYINMAPLHDDDSKEFLYCLGLYHLNQLV